MWHNRPDVTCIILHHTTQLIVITAQRVFKERVTQSFGRSGLPLQLLSSQGKTQFCMPLHTREVLMHMLLWQKNALLEQGAETQKTQLAYQQPGNLSVSFHSRSKSCFLITDLSLNLSISVWLLYIMQENFTLRKKKLQYGRETTGGCCHNTVFALSQPQTPQKATWHWKKMSEVQRNLKRKKLTVCKYGEEHPKAAETARLISPHPHHSHTGVQHDVISYCTTKLGLQETTHHFSFCLTLCDVRSRWSHVL